MSGNNFGEKFYVSDNSERFETAGNGPIVNSDPIKDKVALDAALIDEWPVEEIVPEGDIMKETLVQEAPGNATIIYRDSVGETVPNIVQPADASETGPVDEQAYQPSSINNTIPSELPEMLNPKYPLPLLDSEESEILRTKWNKVQARFVDEPRSAVKEADALVTEVIGQITNMFAKEHSLLEGRWNQGNETSTEDLRKALQRYRSFFNRLVV